MNILSDWLRKNTKSPRVPLSDGQYKEGFSNTEPSFVDHIPWCEYDPELEMFLMQDGVSLGIAMELAPLDMNTRGIKDFYKLQDALFNCLSTIPRRVDNPWVIQFFLNDEPVSGVINDLYQYAKPDVRDSAYSKHFFKMMEEHLEIVSSEGGMFVDGMTGKPWKGKIRRVRCCIYRKFDPDEQKKKGAVPPNVEMRELRERFSVAMRKAGIEVKPYSGENFYSWMMPWLSPAPSGSDNAWELLAKEPYPVEAERNNDLGADFDLAQFCFKNKPSSDSSNGVWFFSGLPHRYLSLQGVAIPPQPGEWTQDDRSGGINVAMFDELPEDSILAMSIVIESQGDIQRHINKVKNASGGDSGGASRAKKQAEQALDLVSSGELMYRMTHGIYLKADTLDRLDTITNEVTAIVRSKFDAIEPQEDPTSIDSYRHNLPMCYDPIHAKRALRGRLTYARHIARLMPLFGHSRGSGNYGLMYFNRIGEILAFDPLNKKDRTKTAHVLMFGPTGAGKSATLNYNQMFKMATRRPRMFMIEAGNSFGLLAQDFERHGLKVEHIRFKKSADISIPPFANAILALEEEEKNSRYSDPDYEPTDEEIEDDSNEDERDYMGEMVESLKLMVTSADIDQMRRFTPQDRRLMTDSIFNAARTVRERDKDLQAEEIQVITSDVADEMRKLVGGEGLSEARRDRIKELADSLDNFRTGLRAKFFNRKGQAWPEADLTLIDMAELTKEDNKDMLAVALISLINRISDLGEKYQADDREIDVITDEGHVITTNPTISKPMVYGVKTWRKLGIWLTQATQNLADYPNESEKMLNLAEWWILLNLEQGDITELTRFKKLSEVDTHLIESCQKEIPNYTEGVVLSNKINARFRVVQPALCLTLAMTESDEKAERQDLMSEHGLDTELDAAYFMADQISTRRRANTVRANS